MYQTAIAKALANNGESNRAESQPSHHLLSAPWRVWAVVLALLYLPGCNALNPLCGSARPAPVIGSLSATWITMTQLQKGFVLDVNGREFVSSSVVIINGTTLATTVLNNKELQVTIPTDLVSGPGAVPVTVKTPSGNSGNLGCTSGGTSGALTLTIN
jgi:hypothetical protein